jgi:HEAT repeat protein
MILLMASLPAVAPAQGPAFLDKPLSAWVKDLGSPDAKVRRSASFAIGKIGPDAASAVPRLLAALRDTDPTVADAAAFALGEIGPGAASALPSLVVVLEDKKADPRVRRSAAYAIGCLKPNHPSAVAALAGALDDASPAVRQNAAWSLGRIPLGLTAPAILKGLETKINDSDPVVRRDVAGAIGNFGHDAHRTLPTLLARLPGENDVEVRKAILNTLVNLVGPEDTSAVPALRAALKDTDSDAVRFAAFALGNIGGGRAAPAVPVLREALTDPAVSVRRRAAGSLANIGPDAVSAVPELSRALADTDAEVQSRSALALSGIGPKASAAVPDLAKALRAKSAEVRLYSAEALSRIATNLEPAVDELVRLLKEDAEPNVRQRAVWALGRVPNLDGHRAARALEDVLSEKSPDTVIVRYEAARYLAHGLGPKAPDKAIDILTDMLKDDTLRIYTKSDAKVTSGAEDKGGATVTANIAGDGRVLPCQAIAVVGPKANRPDVVRALEDCAKSSDKRLREGAQDALRKIREK